jgi:hypothetical protein
MATAFSGVAWLLLQDGIEVQELPVKEDRLFFSRAAGILGIPLPMYRLPKSSAREYDRGGVFHFDAHLYAAFADGLIIGTKAMFSRVWPVVGNGSPCASEAKG